MEIRVLKRADLGKLYQFEVTNQYYFEQFIEPREQGFFTGSGFSRHVDTVIADFIAGVGYPLIVESKGKIIARVNLRDIDRSLSQAFLGYRVAELSVGKGLASMVVRHLCWIARHYLNLHRLTAYVSIDNIASKNVLERSNFKYMKEHDNYVVIHSRPLNCLEYQLDLD